MEVVHCRRCHSGLLEQWSQQGIEMRAAKRRVILLEEVLEEACKFLDNVGLDGDGEEFREKARLRQRSDAR
jgi:hypothetical protein